MSPPFNNGKPTTPLGSQHIPTRVVKELVPTKCVQAWYAREPQSQSAARVSRSGSECPLGALRASRFVGSPEVVRLASFPAGGKNAPGCRLRQLRQGVVVALPIPPYELPDKVGPTDEKAFDNPSGRPIYPYLRD